MMMELDRQTVQEIRTAAREKARVVAGELWRRAYDRLADAADVLDKMKAEAQAPRFP